MCGLFLYFFTGGYDIRAFSSGKGYGTAHRTLLLRNNGFISVTCHNAFLSRGAAC
jgi:hypothetical protein